MLSEQISPEAKNTGTEQEAGSGATLAYVAPFVVFVALLGLRHLLPVPYEAFALFRFVVVAATIALFSRRVISWRVSMPMWSVLLGLSVCAIWIGPDVIWPGYRHQWLFQNSMTGSATSTLPDGLKTHFGFLTLRVLESAILIPILEELFWRGWLMRWLIRPNFTSVPLGTYAPAAFWVVAALFASEHGPYWEVGLIAGIAYNWWMVRTRSLADCILAHGITNLALAAYVIRFGQWQYWL